MNRFTVGPFETDSVSLRGRNEISYQRCAGFSGSNKAGSGEYSGLFEPESNTVARRKDQQICVSYFVTVPKDTKSWMLWLGSEFFLPEP